MGALDYDGVKGIGEPREIKWGLSHEGEFFLGLVYNPPAVVWVFSSM